MDKYTKKIYLRLWRLNHPNKVKQYREKYFRNHKRYCIDCGVELTGHSKVKRCKKHSNIQNAKRRNYFGKKNPNYNNHILKGRFAGAKNPMYGKKGQSNNTKNTIVEHHIDLNNINNRKTNKLILTHSIHSKLHQRAYEYLVKKGLIRKYIKWFFKNKLTNEEKQLLKEIK
jgi:hypothetical protein